MQGRSQGDRLRELGLTQRQSAQAAQAQAHYEGLVRQRGELTNQMQQLTTRRDQLFAQAHSASPAQRPQLEQRMAEIDGRMARLDRQIESLNDQIAEALAQENAATSQGPQGFQGPAREIRIPQITIPPIDFGRNQRRTDVRQIGGIMAAEAVALVLLGLVFWRVGMRRMRDQFDRMFSAQTQHLAQLQQSVDTVAVEVERISEAQRYVAKVLTEGSPPSSQAAKPIPQTVPRER